MTAIPFIQLAIPPSTEISTSRPLQHHRLRAKVSQANSQVSASEEAGPTSVPPSRLLLQRLLSIPRSRSGGDECPRGYLVGAPTQQPRRRFLNATPPHSTNTDTTTRPKRSNSTTLHPRLTARIDKTELKFLPSPVCWEEAVVEGGGGREGGGGGRFPPSLVPLPHLYLYQPGSWVNERSRATDCLSRKYTDVVLPIPRPLAKDAFRKWPSFIDVISEDYPLQNMASREKIPNPLPFGALRRGTKQWKEGGEGDGEGGHT